MTTPEPSPPTVESSLSPRRRRRWLRFGIRGLLVLVAVIAVPLAWWVNSVHRQRQAIAAIRAVCPDATIYTYGRGILDGRHHFVDPGWRLRLIAWIDQRVPADYLHPVRHVWIDRDSPERPLNFTSVMDAIKTLDHLESLTIDSGVQNSDIMGLDRLTDLVDLNLSGPSPNLTDTGLATLLKIPTLLKLSIGDCAATDAWMVRLKALPHLEKLNLGDSEILVTGKSRLRITGAGLAGLPQLTELGLSSPSLTHNGLAQLRPLRKIEALKLGGPLTPSDLVNLQTMSKLDDLTLTNTELHGQGLEALGRLPSLATLFFCHELIDDSHLPKILAIPTLSHLRFWDTDVTPAGALAFRNAHPRMPASEYDLNVRVGSPSADRPVRPRPLAHLNDATPPPSGAKP